MTIDAGLIGRLLPGQNKSIPLRYGLTVGELIGGYLKTFLPPLPVHVIPMKKWYQINDSEWVMSSPNMPTIDTVRVYPGMGLFEGTSISEGRGTTKPFQLTGFPKNNSKPSKNPVPNITGALLRPTYFIPTFSKHEN